MKTRPCQPACALAKAFFMCSLFHRIPQLLVYLVVRKLPLPLYAILDNHGCAFRYRMWLVKTT